MFSEYIIWIQVSISQKLLEILAPRYKSNLPNRHSHPNNLEIISCLRSWNRNSFISAFGISVLLKLFSNSLIQYRVSDFDLNDLVKFLQPETLTCAFQVLPFLCAQPIDLTFYCVKNRILHNRTYNPKR